MGEYKDLTDDKFDYFDDKPFSYYRLKLNPYNGAGDCLIRAIMKCLDTTTLKDWESIYKALYDISVPMHKVFNDMEVAETFLSKYDYEYVEYTPKERINVKRFAETHPTGNFILILDRHSIAYIDGILYDNRRIVSNEMAKHLLEDTYTVYAYFEQV